MIKMGGKSPSYYTLGEFRFSSGEKIRDAPVEYITRGTPVYDKEGLIDNAILYIHGWSGDYSSIRRINGLMGQGGALEDYFIISPSTLGSPGSASPSSTGLGKDFPNYTILDMVEFQRQFLIGKFGIKRLKGIIGTSMGGFQALQWAVTYPDFMEFIMPLVTSYRVAGINFAIFRYMNHLIETDPDFIESRKPSRALSLASMFMYLYGLSREYYHTLDKQSLCEAMDSMGAEGDLMDENDVILRNRAAMHHNLEGELHRVKARALIVGINQDQYFPPELETLPMAENIRGAEVILFDSECGHLGINEIGKFNRRIKTFIENLD